MAVSLAEELLRGPKIEAQLSNEPLKAEARALRARGMSVRAIAQKLGVVESTIWSWTRKGVGT